VVCKIPSFLGTFCLRETFSFLFLLTFNVSICNPILSAPHWNISSERLNRWPILHCRSSVYWFSHMMPRICIGLSSWGKLQTPFLSTTAGSIHSNLHEQSLRRRVQLYECVRAGHINLALAPWPSLIYCASPFD
jgi:hypothetical protein